MTVTISIFLAAAFAAGFLARVYNLQTIATFALVVGWWGGFVVGWLTVELVLIFYVGAVIADVIHERVWEIRR